MCHRGLDLHLLQEIVHRGTAAVDRCREFAQLTVVNQRANVQVVNYGFGRKSFALPLSLQRELSDVGAQDSINA